MYMIKRRTSDGLFFRFGDGRHLTRNRSVRVVSTALVVSGVNPSYYVNYSFRIGTVTIAAN